MNFKKVLTFGVMAALACGIATVNMAPERVSAAGGNLLSESDTTVSEGKHIHQAGDAFDFDPATLGGQAKCADRSLRVLQNEKLDCDMAVVDGQKVWTSSLDVDYSAKFTYAEITLATYNHVGIVVGVDGDGVYHTIQMEVYKQGAGDHRGFLFEGSSAKDGTDPFHTTTIVTQDYEVGNGFTMSIHKSGNDYAVSIDGNEIATRTIEGLTPTFGLYIFGTYTTYSEASFKYDADVTSYVKSSLLDRARKSTSYVVDDNFTIGGNIRGWSDVATASGKTAAFGTNDGKDIRRFDQVDVSKSAIDDKLVDPSTLSVYYSADITYTGRTNENGAIGLLIGKKALPNGTRYITLNIEANRGHSLFYYFDVNEAGTTTVEANIESYLFLNGVHHVLSEGQSYKFEVLKVGDKYSIYFDGAAVFEEYTGSLDGSELLDGIEPVFGITSNWVEASYNNLTFKVLDKGFSIKSIIIDDDVVAARMNRNVVFKNNYAVSGNVRASGEDVITAEGKNATIADTWGRDARVFSNISLNNLRIAGEKPEDLTDLSVYYSANIKFGGNNDQYGSFGFLVGTSPLENGGTRYINLVIEPGRGFPFFYIFDANADGGVTSEANLNQGVMLNESVKHPLKADDEFRLEVIKNADTYSIFFNGEVMLKGITSEFAEIPGKEIDNVTPVFGLCTYSCKAELSNLEFKVLNEGAYLIDPEVEAARKYDSRNLLADEDTRVSGLLINNPGFQGDRFDFDGNTLTGNAWCTDRTMRSLINYDMYNKHVLIDGVKTSKAACDVYYSCTFTYNQITLNTYNHIGIVVGKGADGNYRSIQLECYQEGSSDHRGFIFTGTSAGVDVTPIYTDSKIEASDYAAGASWTMEIIKRGNDYSVFINGIKYVTTTIEDLVPEYGIYSYGTYGELSNMCCKIISPYEEYTPDEDTTLKTFKIDGESVPGFVPEVTEYTIYADKSEWPTEESEVECETTSSLSTWSKVIDAENGKVTVTVLSEAGYTQDYVVQFAEPLSEDATLASLKIKGQSVEIADVMNFTAPAHVKSLAVSDIIATPNDGKASAEVTVSGNIVTIVVTAESGATKTYVVNVTWNLSANANLSALKVNGESVKDFKPETTEYTVQVNKAITAEDIEAIAADDYATVRVAAGEKKFTITVTAENGTTKVYTLNVVEAKELLVSISASGAKSEFTKGDTFESTGLKVTATYADGSTKDVTAEAKLNLDNVDMAVEGKQVVGVEFGGKTTSYEITVKAKGGCGGTIAAGGAMIALIATAGAIIFSKKRRNIK